MSFPIPCLSRKTLVNSLAEALAVEQAMEKTLGGQFQESCNAEASRLYGEHAEVSAAQQARLGQHLEQMGELSAPSRGGFMASLSAVGPTGISSADPLEREAQNLRASYVRAQLECAMYRALQAQASSLRDDATWRLAREHLAQEEAYVRRLWPYVGLLTELAATSRTRRFPEAAGLAYG